VTRYASTGHKPQHLPLPWLQFLPEPQDQERISRGTPSSGRLDPPTKELTKQQVSAQCCHEAWPWERSCPQGQATRTRSHFSFLTIAVWEERDLLTHATPQCECRGRTVPTGTTGRAAPSPAASRSVATPIKCTRGVGTTSLASPAQPGCSKPCEELHGPSAAGQEALLKKIKTLHLRTQGFNEMILEFSLDVSSGLFEPHVSRDWDPLLRSSRCLSQTP